MRQIFVGIVSMAAILSGLSCAWAQGFYGRAYGSTYTRSRAERILSMLGNNPYGMIPGRVAGGYGLMNRDGKNGTMNRDGGYSANQSQSGPDRRDKKGGRSVFWDSAIAKQNTATKAWATASQTQQNTEDRANARLRLGKQLLASPKTRQAGIKWLEKLIESFPESTAADEAMGLINAASSLAAR